jgi:hypothetical protein
MIVKVVGLVYFQMIKAVLVTQYALSVKPERNNLLRKEVVKIVALANIKMKEDLPLVKIATSVFMRLSLAEKFVQIAKQERFLQIHLELLVKIVYKVNIIWKQVNHYARTVLLVFPNRWLEVLLHAIVAFQVSRLKIISAYAYNIFCFFRSSIFFASNYPYFVLRQV